MGLLMIQFGLAQVKSQQTFWYRVDVCLLTYASSDLLLKEKFDYHDSSFVDDLDCSSYDSLKLVGEPLDGDDVTD